MHIWVLICSVVLIWRSERVTAPLWFMSGLFLRNMLWSILAELFLVWVCLNWWRVPQAELGGMLQSIQWVELAAHAKRKEGWRKQEEVLMVKGSVAGRCELYGGAWGEAGGKGPARSAVHSPKQQHDVSDEYQTLWNDVSQSIYVHPALRCSPET